MNIRRADPKENEILTELAVASEAHWGYNKNFLNAFRRIYSITEDYIMNHPTFVMEDDDEIIGFYNLIESEEEVSLEYFYIDPVNIRKGYGSQLWDHLVDFCKNEGILEFHFVSSPEARKFYEKMGAVVVGEVDSRIMTDRRILKWKFVV